MSTNQVSRRSFLRGAGAASLGVAAAAALAGCAAGTSAKAEAEDSASASAQTAANGLETRYDVDILIVGGGLAGLSAGVQALEAGIDPERLLLIDKMSGEGMDYGGSSMLTGGNFLLPADDSDSSKQAYVEAVYTRSGSTTDRELIEVMGENALDTLDWLISNGCEYGDASEYLDGLWQRTMAGSGTVFYMRQAYESKGGQILFGAKAQHLNVGPNGVCGVTASDAKGYFDIAAKEVILATGGYSANPAILEQLLGSHGSSIVSRPPYSITGDGIAMVQEVGGDLAKHSTGLESIYLSCTHAQQLSSGHASRVLKYCIALNKNGERFCDEAVLDNSTQDYLRILFEQPGCQLGMLTDSKRAEEMADGLKRYDDIGCPYTTVDTLDEAAKLLELDADVLKATVDEYNAHVQGDHTEGLAVNKTTLAAVVDTPPYYVFYPYLLSTSLVFGGIIADTEARVTQADGTVIPHLYAAGELAGGFFHDLYLGGSQQSKAAIFGRIAANTAMSSLS